MDGKHPQNINPRPKRRKDRDNPYSIFTAGTDAGYTKYYITFRDCSGESVCMEIEKELFDAIDRFELDDLSFLNEVDRHYEQSELTEASLHARSSAVQESVDEIVFRRLQYEQLYHAIAELPEVQRRRLTLYYFGEFTYEQIAAMEGCTIMPVKRSIDAGLEKLKKFLK